MEALLRRYERVRVVDMAKVDLVRFRFDYDLTFCLLLMDPYGRILHTFGGRDATGAESHLSLEALRRVLAATLEEWEGRERGVVDNGSSGDPITIEDNPAFAARRARGEAKGCVHCHTIFQMETESLKEAGRFRREDAFRWPDPIQIGIALERDDPQVVASVVPGSAAATAGLRAGDRLRSADGTGVLTFGDLQRILHERGFPRGTLDLVYDRGEQAGRTARVPLAKGWKTPDPAVYAWRSSKWPLDPKPGFGGPDLGEAEKRRLGVPPGDYAFRVNYLVTWGPEADTGRRAQAAGLRKGDVVLSFAGKRDFSGQDHFHAWVRLTRTPGERVPVEILRDGKRTMLQLELGGR